MTTPALSLDQIAERLQGYDPQALSASQVNAFLAQLVQPVREQETVALMQAHGRILAQDVVSPISVPPHDNSAMDGFAFDGATLGAGPLTLRVAGTAYAGKAWAGSVQPGECLKIMTGAIMPAGLDTVVPLEFVQVEGDRITLPAGILKPGDNRRFKGEDLMEGRAALHLQVHVGRRGAGRALLARRGHRRRGGRQFGQHAGGAQHLHQNKGVALGLGLVTVHGRAWVIGR